LPGAGNKAIPSSSFVLGPSVQIWKYHPYIGQNVSPAAHAVSGITVINCGIEIYGIRPRDSYSLGCFSRVKRKPQTNAQGFGVISSYSIYILL